MRFRKPAFAALAWLVVSSVPAVASPVGERRALILAQAAEEQAPGESAPGPSAPATDAAPAGAPAAAPAATPPADAAAAPAAPTAPAAPAPDSVQPATPPVTEPAPLVAPAEPASPAASATPAPATGAEPLPVPGVLRGEEAMPEPVRQTWRKLVEAARSGDIERLRPIMEGQGEPPTVALAEIDDPLDYLRSLSGDAESREILAILLEVLESGFVHVDEGTPQEMFLWPYFARYPLDSLTPPQFVELFRLLTSADYQEMRSYGAYIFFRVGIAPDGTWRFFVAGD